MYDKVHDLGNTLKNSRPTRTDSGKLIAPRIELSKGAQAELETQINNWIEKVKRYLDHCNMRPRKVLWHYDRKNPETWASSPQFKYTHLMQDNIL
jgi:hypothetical protein